MGPGTYPGPALFPQLQLWDTGSRSHHAAVRIPTAHRHNDRRGPTAAAVGLRLLLPVGLLLRLLLARYFVPCAATAAAPAAAASGSR